MPIYCFQRKRIPLRTKRALVDLDQFSKLIFFFESIIWIKRLAPSERNFLNSKGLFLKYWEPKFKDWHRINHRVRKNSSCSPRQHPFTQTLFLLGEGKREENKRKTEDEMLARKEILFIVKFKDSHFLFTPPFAGGRTPEPEVVNERKYTWLWSSHSVSTLTYKGKDVAEGGQNIFITVSSDSYVCLSHGCSFGGTLLISI